MKTSSIVEAKNNLSQLIHQLEAEQPIELTRHGKAVAVMLSASHYQKLISPTQSIYAAILSWQNEQDEEQDISLSHDELIQIRTKANGREFSWED